MTHPLSEADILFPHLANTPNFSNTLSSLRRSALSIHNRLTSIISDSEFVASVSKAYQLPLVANERCGSWYIPPENKTDGVYFKSTDGHMGQWSFSLRRLNLQLLDVVENYGGAVIVDSTRRGKSMPDALSKTIPIWCCVINRALFGTEGEHAMYTPPRAVSSSEHSQIVSRIDGFTRQFLDTCKSSIPELRAKLCKPLRPMWITQQSSLPESPPVFTEFYPIVLCTASHRVHGAEASESGYIQGAADDHEAWSHGLTPAVFWKHKNLLMKTNEEEAPEVVAKLLEQESENNTSWTATLIKPTTNLYISTSQRLDLTSFDVVISCTPEPIPPNTLKEAKVKHYFPLKCQTGKLGSRDLRNELSLLLHFLTSLTIPSPPKILICCPTGKDLSVGTALAILCLHVSETGYMDLSTRRDRRQITKTFIKQRLSWIMTSNPSLHPSRSTLQSVNAILLTTPALRTPPITTLPIRSNPPQSIPPSHKQTQSPQHKIFTSLSHSPSWTFTRTLTSRLPTHPSGTVTGTATFTPCVLPPTFPPTLLYAEEGDFITSSGMEFHTRRKYVYQLCGGGIVVRFLEDGGDVVGRGEGIGGVFVEMGGLGDGDGDGDGDVEFKSKEMHLCGEDLYGARWRFGKGMVGVEDGGGWWEVRYDVKGPKKDYVSWTRYEWSR